MDTPRKRGLWRWFAVGFFMVFIGILVFYPITAMHPSGQSAVRLPLWRFYSIALPQYFGMSTLGPASSNSAALPVVVFEHVALAAVGGSIAAAIGWWRRKTVSS